MKVVHLDQRRDPAATDWVPGEAAAVNASPVSRILLVGPLPPPMTGTHVTFDIVRRELMRVWEPECVDVIDTSQKQLKQHTRIASFRNLRQAGWILRQYRRKLRSAGRVLIFGSNGFLLSMAPLLVLLARRAGKPISVRAFGGSLDRFLVGLNPAARRLLVWMLRNADTVSVQTELLRASLQTQIGDRVHQAPGFRYVTDGREHAPDRDARPNGPLRLVFVGLLREDKGVLVLLESLRSLAAAGPRISCDLYGSVWPAFAQQFEHALRQTTNAAYKGVLDPAAVVSAMSGYDVLVFPSFYPGEGHPGVLIESMMAGIASITTSFRSIPELITHRHNGLLVPVQNASALADALRTVDADRRLLTEMSHNNWHGRAQFDAHQVVPRLLDQMGAAPVANRISKCPSGTL